MPKVLLHRRLAAISRWMAWVAGGALVLTACLVSTEVLLRKLFSISLNVATEYSAYVLGMCAAWGFAFALFAHAHVRVDAAIRLLPRRLAAFADVAALLSLIAFAAMLSYYGFNSLAESWRMSARAPTPIGTPLWIPQLLWVLGLVFFLLCGVALLLRALRLLSQGHIEESRRLIGTGGVAEEGIAEVADILHSAKAPRP
jgi:TRAP-type mannitol/chloroaromatic compound transport system permease small subunit